MHSALYIGAGLYIISILILPGIKTFIYIDSRPLTPYELRRAIEADMRACDTHTMSVSHAFSCIVDNMHTVYGRDTTYDNYEFICTHLLTCNSTTSHIYVAAGKRGV